MIQIFKLIKCKTKELHNDHLDKFNNKIHNYSKVKHQYHNNVFKIIHFSKTHSFSKIIRDNNSNINKIITNFMGIIICKNKNKIKLNFIRWIQ